MRERTPMVAVVAVAALLGITACGTDELELEASEPQTAPTAVPTPVPTEERTPEPTAVPTPVPTEEPTAAPEPTAEPTSSPPDADAAVDLAEDFIGTDSFLDLDDSERTCIALGVIEAIGVDRLDDLDTGDEPTLDEIDATVDAMFDCVDPLRLGEMVSSELQTSVGIELDADVSACVASGYADAEALSGLLYLGFLESSDEPLIGGSAGLGPITDCLGLGGFIALTLASEGVELSESSVACIDDEGGDLFAEIMTDFLGGGEPGVEAENELFTVLLGCLTPEELGLVD